MLWLPANRCTHSRSGYPENVVTEYPFASNRCAARPRTSTIPYTALLPTEGKAEATLPEVPSSNPCDRLLRALRSAAPNFDEASLSLQKDGSGSYIAFAGEMELDDSQLSLLGLKDGSRS